jgi:hypothetical protein
LFICSDKDFVAFIGSPDLTDSLGEDSTFTVSALDTEADADITDKGITDALLCPSLLLFLSVGQTYLL